jgi:hypothetical protein
MLISADVSREGFGVGAEGRQQEGVHTEENVNSARSPRCGVELHDVQWRERSNASSAARFWQQGQSGGGQGGRHQGRSPPVEQGGNASPRPQERKFLIQLSGFEIGASALKVSGQLLPLCRSTTLD